MLKVPDITNDPRQKFTINLPEGNRLALEMRFCPTQNAWYLDIDYNDGEWVLKGTQIVTAFNLLLPFENVLNFGIAILTDGNSEPYFVDDFFDGQMHYVYFGKQGRFEAIKNTGVSSLCD